MVCVGFMSELRSYKREYNLQNQELERQHDYTNMYLLKTMSWADMQKSKRPREMKVKSESEVAQSSDSLWPHGM